MKKKFNVIQINGFTGILLVVLILGCAITGFILFPSWCCMQGWNFIASIMNFPKMTIIHGGVLWVSICLMLVACYGSNPPLKVSSVSGINPRDVKKTLDIMNNKQSKVSINQENKDEKITSNKEN